MFIVLDRMLRTDRFLTNATLFLGEFLDTAFKSWFSAVLNSLVGANDVFLYSVILVFI